MMVKSSLRISNVRRFLFSLSPRRISVSTLRRLRVYISVVTRHPPSPRVPVFFSFNRTCSPVFTVPAHRCHIRWVFKVETSLLQASSCLTCSKQQRFHATVSSHPRCGEIYSIWCSSATPTQKMIHRDGSVFSLFPTFSFFPTFLQQRERKRENCN